MVENEDASTQLPRVFLSGFPDDVTEKDIQSLVSRFSPLDFHLNDKGYAFATIQKKDLSSCTYLLRKYIFYFSDFKIFFFYFNSRFESQSYKMERKNTTS